MNSRTKIFDTIKRNKRSDETNVDLAQFFADATEQETLDAFCTNVLINDGKFIVPDAESDLPAILENEIKGKLFVDFSGLVRISQGRIDIGQIKQPGELAGVKVLILRGILAVAENAAVWWEDKTVCNLRVLPFIVEQTIFIVSKKCIVPSMHHAYQKLGILQSGFGCFISGPSKTGDIEQVLVTGAHGALSHLVVLV